MLPTHVGRFRRSRTHSVLAETEAEFVTVAVVDTEGTLAQQVPLPAHDRDRAERLERFRASAVARELFGDAFVDHIADSREWQEREFRGLVTDRELERFFELA